MVAVDPVVGDTYVFPRLTTTATKEGLPAVLAKTAK
jgi:hypothetical protein